jgi:hypothetical protein
MSVISPHINSNCVMLAYCNLNGENNIEEFNHIHSINVDFTLETHL